MAKIEVRNPFTLDQKEHSKRSAIIFKDESLTVQDDVQRSDINFIVHQFGVTGELPYGRIAPMTGDFTQYPDDYQSAQNLILEANQAFAALPSGDREYFKNDPGNYLAFIDNPENREKAIEFGYIPKPEPTPPADGLPLPKDDTSSTTA